MIDFSKIIGFEWDKWNIDKNWLKHKVTVIECEEIFMNEPLLIDNDTKHSKSETRYHAMGKTNLKRLLFMSFTLRKEKIRIISSRDMNKKEKNIYNNIGKNYEK